MSAFSPPPQRRTPRGASDLPRARLQPRPRARPPGLPLLVADKPQVARDWGRLFGAQREGPVTLVAHSVRITWWVGDLAQLVPPDTCELVNACDTGREGEWMFRTCCMVRGHKGWGCSWRPAFDAVPTLAAGASA